MFFTNRIPVVLPFLNGVFVSIRFARLLGTLGDHVVNEQCVYWEFTSRASLLAQFVFDSFPFS